MKLKQAGALAISIVLSLSFAAFSPLSKAQAAATTPFAARFSANANGAIVSIGNTTTTCSDSMVYQNYYGQVYTVNTPGSCAAAKAGGNYNDNDFVMGNWDNDSDSSTFNSSASYLNLPAGATVLWAGLYWGARLDAGYFGDSAATASGGQNRWQMSFKAPNMGSYQTIYSSVEFGPNSSMSNAYQEFYDITSIVQAGGNGYYWGANVAAATGSDRYSGWTMTVAYTAPGMPLRNLTVFDGFNAETGSPISITVSGFKAPAAGSVDAQLSMLAWEGDLASTGDYTTLNSTQLASAASPGSNFFDSVASYNGQVVPDCGSTNPPTSSGAATSAAFACNSPGVKNLLGVDIKNLSISGAIPNNATSATFKFGTGGEVYMPGMLALAINLYAPDFTASGKSVTNNTSTSTQTKPGDTLTYLLSYSNTGQDPAENSISTDPLPAGVTYVPGSLKSLTGTGGSSGSTSVTDAAGDDMGEYNASNRTITMRLGCTPTTNVCTGGGEIAVGASYFYSFQVTVDADAGDTTISNLAHLAYTTKTTGVAATYDTPPVSTYVSPLADVAITKSMTPNPALAGQEGTTTLVVTNNGPNTATGISFNDPLPADYEFSSITAPDGVSCTTPAVGSTGTVTCTLASLANGDSVTVTINGEPSSSSDNTTLANIATVTTTTADPNPNNNVASVSIPMSQAADLSVAKTPNPNQAPAGSTITYQITATNNGPSDATNVVINDTVANPQQLVIIDATPQTTGLTCPNVGPTSVQCQIASLPALATATATVRAYIVPSVAAGTTITNTASVASQTTDPTPGNNTNTDVTVTQAQADMSMAKTATASSYGGGKVSYTLTATNNGPSDAANVVITDHLPAGFTYDANSLTYNRGTCSVDSSNLLTCTAATVPGPLGPTGAKAFFQVNLTGTLDPGIAAGTLSNTATVSTTSNDPVSSNNSATATTTVTSQADVQVTKVGSLTTIPNPGGSQVTFTITATNAGPSVAREVTLCDLYPDQLTFVSATPRSPDTTCGANSGQWNIGDMPVGTQTYTVTLQSPTSYAPDPSSLEQQVTIATSSLGDDPSNNTATWTMTGGTPVDLALTKASNGPLTAGQSVVYTLTVQNNSNSNDADSPVITDTLPDGVTFVPSSTSGSQTDASCSASGQTVTCSKGSSLDYGQSWSVKVQGTLASSYAGTSLTNTATVTSSTADPSLANNSASVTDTVSQNSDTSITFTIAPPASSYTGPGSQRTVTIIATNNGTSDAQNVVIHSNVATTSILDQSELAAIDCQGVNQELVCNVGTLAAGASVTKTFHFTVASYVTPNNYVACGGTPDGSHLYNPPHAATCPSGDSEAGQIPGGWADISTDTAETNWGNNGMYAPLSIGAAGTELAITKTALGTTTNPANSYIAGGLFSYQLQITTDDADAQNVVVTDPLPTGFTATAITTSQGTCDTIPPQGATSITCNLGTVSGPDSAGGSQQVTITVSGKLSTTVPSPPSAVNIATAKSSTPHTNGATYDMDPAQGTATVNIFAQADLQQYKIADAATSYAGGQVGYTLLTVNNGPSAVSDAQVVDTLPVGLIFNPTASTIPTGVKCEATGDWMTTGQTITCVGDPSGIALDNAQNLSIHIVADTDQRWTRPYWCPGQDPTTNPTETCDVVDPPTHPDNWDGKVGDITNTATVSSSAQDSKPGNNTASITTDMKMLADIAVTANASSMTPVAGSNLSYTLTGVNNGPSTADNPVTTAIMPPGFIPLDSNGDPCADGDTSCPAINVPTMTCSFTHTGDVPSSINTYNPDLVYTLHCVGLKPTPYRDSFLTGFVIPGTVLVHIPADTPAGAYTSTNNTTTTTPESNYDNNTAPVTVSVTVQADTALTKEVVGDVDAGSTVTYKLTTVNNGPSLAHNVVMSDPVPSGLTFASGTTASGDDCTIADDQTQQQVVKCAAGDLEPGQSTSATVTFTIPREMTGQICNAALTGSEALDPDASNNPAQVCSAITPAPRADIMVSKAMTPNNPLAGQALTTTITVTNNGPDAGDNVTATDQLPNEIIPSSVEVSSGESCATPARGGTLNCNLGTMAVGTTKTITIKGTLASDSPASAVTNVATVATDTLDPDLTNNTASASVPMAQAADLQVTKTADPATAPAGSTITYTITAKNNGPSDAVNVYFDDNVADYSQLVIQSVTPGSSSVTCDNTTTKAECTVPTLKAGESASATVTAYVVPSVPAGTQVRNTASVISDTTDPNTDNNHNTDVTISEAESDLALSKTSTAASYGGGRVSYTLTAVNYGPSDAQNATIVDTLPAGVHVDQSSITANSGTCTVDTSGAQEKLTCVRPTFPAPLGASGPTASFRVTFSATLDSDLVSGSITNRATVSSDSKDTNPDNNDARADTSLSSQADVQVVKTADTVVVPQTGTTDGPNYTVTVSNNGPSVATDVVLCDVMPSDLALKTSVSPNPDPAPDGTCGNGGQSWNIGNLNVGQSKTVTFAMQANYTTRPDTVVQDASVSTTSTDPNQSNNEASWILTQSAAADLQLVKTSASASGSGPLVAGDKVIYTLTATNLSTDGTSAVTPSITDTLPAGVTFDASGSDPSCALSSGAQQTVTCSDASNIAAGGTWQVKIQGTIASTLADGTVITNSATVSSTTPDPTLSNNSATVTDTLTVLADVSIDFTITGPDASAGQYTGPGSIRTGQITITNKGPSLARHVIITSDVAATSTLLDLPSYCYKVNQELVCDLSLQGGYPQGNMPATGADSTLTFSYQFVVASSDAGGQSFLACNPEHYGPPDRCDNPGGWAEVSTSTPESNLGNNGDSQPYDIGDAKTDLQITKTALDTVANPSDQDPSYVAGTPFSYKMQVTIGNGPEFTYHDPVAGDMQLHTGAADAQDVVISDTMPADFTITNVTASKFASGVSACTISADRSQFSCDVGKIAGPSANTSAQIVTVVVSGVVDADRAPGEQIPNEAVATSTTPSVRDSGPSRVTSVADVDVIDQADLVMYKAADSADTKPGGQVGWTLTVHNNGPSAVRADDNPIVTDTLPLGVTPVTTDGRNVVTDSGAACEITGSASDGRTIVTCHLSALAVGQGQSIHFLTDVGADVSGTLLNMAVVSSKIPDVVDNNTAYAKAESIAPTPPGPTPPTPPAEDVTDVALKITANDKKVKVGSSATFTATVRNNGPDTAKDVTVVFNVPKGYEKYSGVLISSGGTKAKAKCKIGSLICTIGELKPGQVVTYRITGKATKAGSLELSGRVSTTTKESRTDNNFSKAKIEVYREGGILPYTGSNFAGLAALGVLLTLGGLTFLSRRK